MTKKILLLIKENRIFLLILAVILFGAYLRLSNFSDLARFNADQVRDVKIVENISSGKEFPLLGPKAGGTKFNLGPAFYYMQYISGLIFGFTPQGIALFIPILSIFSIYLFYFFLKNIFSEKISLGLSILYAVSFYAIKYSRFAWNPNVIPFFLFGFLNLFLAIIIKKRPLYYHILLGVIIGIGIQLHATLLVLLPILTLGLYIYIFIKNKNIPFVKIGALLLTIIFLNIPFILNDVSKGGENIREFFSGIGSKTQKNVSALTNLKKSISFVAQGTAYVLTGFEPQKDWSKPVKLILSKNKTEILGAFFSLLILSIGIFLFFLKIKKEKNQEKKIALICALLFTFMSFFLFTLIGEELNLRFFIIIIFIPFIFIGLIFEFLFIFLNSKIRRYVTILAIITLIILMGLNLFKYRRVYNLENYQEKDSAYGGISLGESRSISEFISFSYEKNLNKNKKALLSPFEFSKSINYFNDRYGIHTPAFSEDDADINSILYFAVENEKVTTFLEKNIGYFLVIDSKKIGRFTVFALELKYQTYKIGLITDIHGKMSKNNGYNLSFDTEKTVTNFISHMNEEFQPDFVVDNGDLVDGTKRKGQVSINDFNLLDSYFQKLKMPFYHVIGNHETRGISKDQWLDLVKQEKTYYYFDNEDLRTIVLDGNEELGIKELDDNYGYYRLSNEQIEWLRKKLSEDTNLRKIVFIHYPILTKNPIPGEKLIDPSQVTILQNIFNENNVLAVFSGHAERVEFIEDGNVRYFIIPGIERSTNKIIHWLDSFAEISINKNTSINLYYKKNSDKKEYEVLKIPSEEFNKIEK